jgi:hypothetical protein
MEDMMLIRVMQCRSLSREREAEGEVGIKFVK